MNSASNARSAFAISFSNVHRTWFKFRVSFKTASPIPLDYTFARDCDRNVPNQLIVTFSHWRGIFRNFLRTSKSYFRDRYDHTEHWIRNIALTDNRFQGYLQHVTPCFALENTLPYLNQAIPVFLTFWSLTSTVFIDLAVFSAISTTT